MKSSDENILVERPGLTGQDQEEYAARLEEFRDDALRPLQKLYGDREDFSDLCNRLFDIAAQGHAARPEGLKDLDRQRLSNPDWFQRSEMLGYACYVDRFAGNLKGVEARIPYLAELGVTYLHLLPLLKPRLGESDGGFAIENYREVNPELGDMEDLVTLATRLRESGTSLCLDLICNHTAQEHEWAQKAIGGDPVYQDYYLLFPDREMPDRYEEQLDEIFPNAAPGNFTYNAEMDRWVWTTFYPYQWDLNYANPAVFAEMLEIILYLANKGVEALRLDSAAHLWKRAGTNCQNQPEVHSLLQAFRALVRIAAPGLLLKAEAIVPPRHLPRYLGTGESANKECHLTYHNTLMALLWSSLAEGSVRLMADTLKDMPQIPDLTAWITYIRCHDDIGWYVLEEPASKAGYEGHGHVKFLADFFSGTSENSFARGANFQVNPEHDVHGTSGTLASLAGLEAALQAGDDVETDLAIQRILLVHSLIFTFGGVPMVNMGDELGLLNNASYRENPELARDSRWLHRPEMDWDVASERADASSIVGRIFTGLGSMAQARTTAPVLHARSESRIVDVGADALFGLLRSDERDQVLVLGNFSAERQTVARDKISSAGLRGELYDCLSRDLLNNGEDVTLDPYASMWLKNAPRNGGGG